MDLRKLTTAFEAAAKDDPATMLMIARKLHNGGQYDDAAELCRRALHLAPDDGWLKAAVKDLVTAHIPKWHFKIFGDALRNSAYDTALRRAVAPGARVLEIGTGSGLLAMMAARAGAREVITCEMDRQVAETARKIISRNGYADRIKVLVKHSDKLDLAEDLGRRADVIVSEIVSSNLLDEGVLPSHERVMRDFAHAGTIVIPARGVVRVALAQDLRDPSLVLNDISGFDVSAFLELAKPKRSFVTGEPEDLFSFDFASPAYHAPGRSRVVCRSSGGPVNGVAQWIKLTLDDVTSYENRPAAGATSNWKLRFYRFDSPVETNPGDEIQVCGAHDRRNVLVWRQE